MGSICDVGNLLLGHWSNQAARTGCTAIIFPKGASAGVDVRGAAPGTRETELLNGYHLVDKINAIMLCGGSAFGLAAADGAMRFLEERGMGFTSGKNIVPIVPAAVLYDLEIGSSTVRPDAEAGYSACLDAAAFNLCSGKIGVGCGATVGKLLGSEFAMDGGIGSSCIELPGGIKVGALLALNALGDIVDKQTGRQLAGPMKDGRMLNSLDLLLQQPVDKPLASNTTIGLIFSNAKLNREQLNRMALLGHDGLALCIRPVHTPFDGDTLFAASSAELELPDEMLPMVFAAATEAVAQAIIDVFEHEAMYD